MLLKHVGHQVNTPICWHVWETHQPCMRKIPHVYKLSKVSIDRHQSSAFGSGAFEQCPIAQIGPKFTGLDNVMPLTA